MLHNFRWREALYCAPTEPLGVLPLEKRELRERCAGEAKLINSYQQVADRGHAGASRVLLLSPGEQGSRYSLPP